MPSAEKSRAITDVNNKYHKVSSLLTMQSRHDEFQYSVL